jgi:RNA polymerase sigma-70 factor (ECF subfamily)
MATATVESFNRLVWPVAAEHDAPTARVIRPEKSAHDQQPGVNDPGVSGDSVERTAAEPDENAVDRALIERVQHGENAAFDLLVKKYQHRVAALLRRHIADPSEIEDVTQEAFIRAYRGLANFRGESAFYTWLYRIAVNTARNYRVAMDRRGALRGGMDPTEAERFDDGVLLRDTETPERHAATGEIRQEIERSIESMPACLREALTLREMNGLSYEEIASVMDCPIGTVRSRIARARTAIDERIRPLLEGRGEPTGGA